MERAKLKIAPNNIGAILAFPKYTEAITVVRDNCELHVGFYEFLKGSRETNLGILRKQASILSTCLVELEANKLSEDTFLAAYKIFLLITVGKNIHLTQQGIKQTIVPRLNIPNYVRSSMDSYRIDADVNVRTSTNLFTLSEMLYQVGVPFSVLVSAMPELDVTTKQILIDLYAEDYNRPYYYKD